MIPIIESSMKPLEVRIENYRQLQNCFECVTVFSLSSLGSEDMDLSRMTERLLRLAVSKKKRKIATWARRYTGLITDGKILLFLKYYFMRYSLLVLNGSLSLYRFPTTCFGWCFSTGSSTLLWTSQQSFCASETDSSTKTGGKYFVSASFRCCRWHFSFSWGFQWTGYCNSWLWMCWVTVDHFEKPQGYQRVLKVSDKVFFHQY